MTTNNDTFKLLLQSIQNRNETNLNDNRKINEIEKKLQSLMQNYNITIQSISSKLGEINKELHNRKTENVSQISLNNNNNNGNLNNNQLNNYSSNFLNNQNAPNDSTFQEKLNEDLTNIKNDNSLLNEKLKKIVQTFISNDNLKEFKKEVYNQMNFANEENFKNLNALIDNYEKQKNTNQNIEENLQKFEEEITKNLNIFLENISNLFNTNNLTSLKDENSKTLNVSELLTPEEKILNFVNSINSGFTKLKNLIKTETNTKNSQNDNDKINSIFNLIYEQGAKIEEFKKFSNDSLKEYIQNNENRLLLIEDLIDKNKENGTKLEKFFLNQKSKIESIESKISSIESKFNDKNSQKGTASKEEINVLRNEIDECKNLLKTFQDESSKTFLTNSNGFHIQKCFNILSNRNDSSSTSIWMVNGSLIFGSPLEVNSIKSRGEIESEKLKTNSLTANDINFTGTLNGLQNKFLSRGPLLRTEIQMEPSKIHEIPFYDEINYIRIIYKGWEYSITSNYIWKFSDNILKIKTSGSFESGKYEILIY